MGGEAEAGRWDVSDGCAVSSGLAWEFSHTLCLAHMHLTYLGSLPGRTKGVALWKAKGGPNCLCLRLQGQCHSAPSTQSPGAVLVLPHYPERTGLTQRREQSVALGSVFQAW